MEIEQVAELARTVAALPQGHQDYFNGLVADERAKAAEAERIAELRDMWDFAVVKKVLWECTDRPQRVDGDAALKMLREAGFVRLSGKLADIMQGITAGIISREEFDKAFGALTLTPGLIEELPPGTAVAWNAQGENRWEVGLRNIVTILRGPRVPFDIPDIVEEVKVLAEGKRPDLQAAYCLGFKSSNNAFNGQTSHPRGERFRNKMDEDLRNLEASQ